MTVDGGPTCTRTAEADLDVFSGNKECFCSSPSVVPGFLCVHVGETPGKQGGDWKLATLTSGVKQAPAAGGGHGD